MILGNLNCYPWKKVQKNVGEHPSLLKNKRKPIPPFHTVSDPSHPKLILNVEKSNALADEFVMVHNTAQQQTSCHDKMINNSRSIIDAIDAIDHAMALLVIFRLMKLKILLNYSNPLRRLAMMIS